MATLPYFTPGIDLLSIPTIVDPECGDVVQLSVVQLQQLIENAEPADPFGWIIVSETTPNIVDNPDLVRFDWVKESTGERRRYNAGTLSWELSYFGSNSLEGSVILDGSLDISKLDAGGIGNAGKFLRVNFAGTFLEYVNLSSAIPLGSIPLSSLQATGTYNPVFPPLVGMIGTGQLGLIP